MSDPQLDRAEAILAQQYDDVPITITEDGQIHPASDGRAGLSIHDAKGDYAGGPR
jgi:hypothetical protein